ncbi:VOC family protein [Gloeobacter kilaueensis]|uniref:Glyoxalase/bleomycin resistance protein/dioxygenase n=1 Tax=Gloeobacter kilaueensis (strain ATCC BAA-2537 / CCAP 1431/1 / ULC 316 / JS1) TaxID=1183438 RepID=U5QL18_GLOK1|nr:VOC family protein [Gloeobacter kilaueensis]AGY58294.1 glyoxalase/bleomycin resistance protein/dioxygenase [Gloeobacter kilaueensis JS1]
MQIQAVHLELRATDLLRSERFYHQLFDAPPTVNHSAGFVLFTVYGAELLVLPGTVVPVRFGFRLARQADLDALARRCSARSLPFERRQFDHPALARREVALNFVDPDGHRCSFYLLTQG